MATDEITPIEVPKPQEQRLSLSEIDLINSSIPPLSEDPTIQALQQVDKVNRAHAGSFIEWRKEQEERFLQAEHERKISRLKAWGTLISSVVAAVGAAIAVVLAALQ
jgi:hypothetical protein